MNNPTILSCTQFSKKISVEIDYSDPTLDELFSMFETLISGLGYHSTSLNNIILEKADKLKREDDYINYIRNKYKWHTGKKNKR